MRADGITIVFGDAGDSVDALAELYRALHDHHVRVAPRLGPLPPRMFEDSWTRRRARYRVWLAEPGAFLASASADGALVGYLLATTAAGYQSWMSADSIGEIKDLAVHPTVRRQGIGSRLLMPRRHGSPPTGSAPTD